MLTSAVTRQKNVSTSPSVSRRPRSTASPFHLAAVWGSRGTSLIDRFTHHPSRPCEPRPLVEPAPPHLRRASGEVGCRRRRPSQEAGRRTTRLLGGAFRGARRAIAPRQRRGVVTRQGLKLMRPRAATVWGARSSLSTHLVGGTSCSARRRHPPRGGVSRGASRCYPPPRRRVRCLRGGCTGVHTRVCRREPRSRCPSRGWGVMLDHQMHMTIERRLLGGPSPTPTGPWPFSSSITGAVDAKRCVGGLCRRDVD
jgi:hypothetical protein